MLWDLLRAPASHLSQPRAKGYRQLNTTLPELKTKSEEPSAASHSGCTLTTFTNSCSFRTCNHTQRSLTPHRTPCPDACLCPPTQGKVRWALAGRDSKKLEEVRTDLIKINPDCKVSQHG